MGKKIVLAWWIASSFCWQGEAWNVWTNGRMKYWLPVLDSMGNVSACVRK